MQKKKKNLSIRILVGGIKLQKANISEIRYISDDP